MDKTVGMRSWLFTFI